MEAGIAVSGFAQKHSVPLGASPTFESFRAAAARAFGLEGRAFIITDTNRLELDAPSFGAWVANSGEPGGHAAQSNTLFVLPSTASKLGLVHREEIDYQPHYTTLEAGFNHFNTLGQGVAEFVDNSVQGTAECAERLIRLHLFVETQAAAAARSGGGGGGSKRGRGGAARQPRCSR